jgi:hypothetical protein
MGNLTVIPQRPLWSGNLTVIPQRPLKSDNMCKWSRMHFVLISHTLEKTEEKTKNGQFKYTANIRYTRPNTKTNKPNNTRQKTNKMSNTKTRGWTLMHIDTTLCDNVCQWFAAGQWYSPGTPVSSTNKTDRNDIA